MKEADRPPAGRIPNEGDSFGRGQSEGLHTQLNAKRPSGCFSTRSFGESCDPFAPLSLSGSTVMFLYPQCSSSSTFFSVEEASDCDGSKHHCMSPPCFPAFSTRDGEFSFGTLYSFVS